MSAVEATPGHHSSVTGPYQINRVYQDTYDATLSQAQDLPKPDPASFDMHSTPATRYPEGMEFSNTQYQTIERVFQTEMDPSLAQNQDPPKPDPASFDMHSTPAMHLSAPELLPPIISETA